MNPMEFLQDEQFESWLNGLTYADKCTDFKECPIRYYLRAKTDTSIIVGIDGNITWFEPGSYTANHAIFSGALRHLPSLVDDYLGDVNYNNCMEGAPLDYTEMTPYALRQLWNRAKKWYADMVYRNPAWT